MSSEKNIATSKVQNLQGDINAIKAQTSTIIEKDESKDQTQKL